MSFVQNTLVTGQPVGEPTSYPAAGAYQRSYATSPAAADAIAYAPAYGQSADADENLYGGSSSGSTGLGNFGNVMNGIMNMLASALGSLSGLFGSSGSSTSSGSTGTGQPWQNVPGSASPQQYFSSATASSVGDPHDAFDGTTGRGTTIGNTWNDMNGRPDLLASDSFAGGYRVSTTDTAPQANGVTYNANATVATDCGATRVTLDADGSYHITDRGRNVTLAEGQAVRLGGNESVTLGSDGSLQIDDTNDRGGSLTTTLSTNGSGGVDVKSSASDVDLGGYLVGRGDANGDGGARPVPPAPGRPIGGGPWPIPFGTMTSQGASDSGSLVDLTQLLASDAPAI